MISDYKIENHNTWNKQLIYDNKLVNKVSGTCLYTQSWKLHAIISIWKTT